MLEEKYCVYGPFLQEKKVYPALRQQYSIMQFGSFKPPVNNDKKKVCSLRMEDRVTYTLGLNIDPTTTSFHGARAPLTSVPPMDKKEKSLFVCAFNILFNMCKSLPCEGSEEHK